MGSEGLQSFSLSVLSLSFCVGTETGAARLLRRPPRSPCLSSCLLPVLMYCHFGTMSPINPFSFQLLVSRPHDLRSITNHFRPPAAASSFYPPSEPSTNASVPPGCSPLRICIQSFWPFLPLIFLKFQLSASP